MPSSEPHTTGQPLTNPRVVFIQAMWRSCGTYIWNKLREATRIHAYFEPCNEWLGGSTRELLDHVFSRPLQRTLRHTAMPDGYFKEYPVMNAGGVDGFEKRFAFENYYQDASTTDKSLQSYIQSLIDHAATKDKIALLKCCRWGLRTEWLKATWPLKSIFVLRAPEPMFSSYWSLGGRNSYFILASVLILCKNRKHPLFSEIADELKMPMIDQFTVAEELRDASEVVERLDEQDIRDMFLLLWILNAATNLRHCDVVIDVDLLAKHDDYRCDIQESIAAMIPIKVSFEDVRTPREGSAPGRLISARGLEIARRAVQTLSPMSGPPKVRLSSGSAGVISACM